MLFPRPLPLLLKVSFPGIMTQVENQLTQGIQGAMEQMMGNISSGMQGAIQSVMTSVTSSITTAMSQAMGQMGNSMGNALSIDPEAFAKAIQMNMNEDDLSELMMSLMSYENTSYDSNLKKLGYADLDTPGGINIYPKDFECKSEIVNILDAYNARMEKEGEDEKVITYTDIVGTLMSSVTDIVNIISYVLVAFVAISLVVSSIMIGVITYISVLERKKEIGILRAIGASKHNVSQVFNAETFIIGFCAGAMGIGITLLLLIPANQLIRSLAGDVNVRAGTSANGCGDPGWIKCGAHFAGRADTIQKSSKERSGDSTSYGLGNPAGILQRRNRIQGGKRWKSLKEKVFMAVLPLDGSGYVRKRNSR